ncbi:hypothetical protein BDW62DRAFT_205723 [Aspergillus aurantiobrunneus]
MFSNDDRFYLYGGLSTPTDSMNDAPADTVLGYEPYQDGESGSGFTITDSGITHGAGVSSPSGNLGFYISGLRAPDWGPQMIKVDMSGQNPVWSNSTLPAHVPARAGAEAVWVPVSKSGAIVLIGGESNLGSIYAAGLSEAQQDESEQVSPGFMETVSVYDIASDTCQPSDNVYVLSLSTFEWILLYIGGGRTNGRKEHTCIRPYPDQMLVLGGRGLDSGIQLCIDMIQVFNLNTLAFQDTYDTVTWSPYEVPNMVSGRIGGGFLCFHRWGGGLIGGLPGLSAVIAAIGTVWFLRRRKAKGSQEQDQEQSELSSKRALFPPAEVGGAATKTVPEAGSFPVYEMNDRSEHPIELPTSHNEDPGEPRTTLRRECSAT